MTIRDWAYGPAVVDDGDALTVAALTLNSDDVRDLWAVFRGKASTSYPAHLGVRAQLNGPSSDVAIGDFLALPPHARGYVTMSVTWLAEDPGKMSTPVTMFASFAHSRPFQVQTLPFNQMAEGHELAKLVLGDPSARRMPSRRIVHLVQITVTTIALAAYVLAAVLAWQARTWPLILVVGLCLAAALHYGVGLSRRLYRGPWATRHDGTHIDLSSRLEVANRRADSKANAKAIVRTAPATVGLGVMGTLIVDYLTHHR